MKKVSFYGGLILLALFLAYKNLDQILLFIFLGKIPFTNLMIPASLMIVFWLVTPPLLIIFGKVIRVSFWRSMEIVGEQLQLHQIRRMRLLDNFTMNVKFLFVISLLHYLSAQESTDEAVALDAQPALASSS